MSIIINGSNTPTAGSAAIGNGTELAFTAAGTSGQVLTSQGASSAIWSAASVPISTGVSGLGTNVASFLATPSSANLASCLTDETGTGANVFATSPTLVTPILGTPSSGTLTSCTGLPISTGVSGLGTSVATFLATPSSANLAAVLTDETGTGANVFATSPALTTPTITGLNETKTALTISVGAVAVDCAIANVFSLFLNAAVTSLTFSNVPTAPKTYGFTLAVTADGTARSLTWPASVKWAGGTAPTLTSTNGKIDIFVLSTWDGGTIWYAMTGGQNF